ncbi:hypothetical protein BL253_06770 [Pseudofrankia asymbiotica]|uniref:Acyltransferase 3 domain-containing protein n=2 Tax=Pseudofrankia asymbiotica TaxID=1834516 RepID=A0A1V2IF75_9ACTN|nr:hypothetical protein BL253_06770 [Pseudofrankia asymbiotica]
MPLGNIGYCGVMFFFMLSGFVLTWSARPGTRKQFYWRRFARIYPLYLVAIALWFVVAWSFGLMGEFGSKPVAVLPSLLLVQAWVPTQAIYFGWGGAVLWSLSCEAFFYLVFPIVYQRLLARTNAGRIRAALLVVVPTAAVACLAGAIDPRLDLALYANPVVRVGEFVLGIVLGLMALDGVRGTANQRRALAVLAVAWLAVPITLGYQYSDHPGLIDTLTLPSFAIIIFLVGTREADGGRVPIASARPLVYFGVVSYAFYLIHPGALAIVTELGLFDTASATEAALAVVAGFLFSIALGALLHHTVEKPAHRYLLRKFKRPPDQRTRPAARPAESMDGDGRAWVPIPAHGAADFAGGAAWGDAQAAGADSAGRIPAPWDGEHTVIIARRP